MNVWNPERISHFDAVNWPWHWEIIELKQKAVTSISLIMVEFMDAVTVLCYSTTRNHETLA